MKWYSRDNTLLNYNKKLIEDLDNYDWITTSKTPNKSVNIRNNSVIFSEGESNMLNKHKMLENLSDLCISCRLCKCGKKPACNDHEKRDPHRLSNMQLSKVMLISNNPTWNDISNKSSVSEVVKDLNKNGISDDMFYHTYCTKCYNSFSQETFELCRSYIDIEIKVLKPKIIIIDGEKVFKMVFPNFDFKKEKFYKIDKYIIFNYIDGRNIKKLSKIICTLVNQKSNPS